MRQRPSGKPPQIENKYNVTNLNFVLMQDFCPGRLLEWDKDTSYLTILETWVPNNFAAGSFAKLNSPWSARECLSLVSRIKFIVKQCSFWK